MKKILMAAALLTASVIGATAQTTPFLGQNIIVAFDYCPNGYVRTSGQILPINPYVALFTVLGTTYGGNGTSNFALPSTQPIFTKNRRVFTECVALTGVYPTQN